MREEGANKTNGRGKTLDDDPREERTRVTSVPLCCVFGVDHGQLVIKISRMLPKTVDRNHLTIAQNCEVKILFWLGVFISGFPS